ncbi:MAG: hypothetical protein HYR96_07670 [Deltaproteobacteria bacterium]|nr:hypothetical protein [Deltaproteobacteria bacterium]MBI3293168.1 hypothetical protein [Deltaproteobacteria bacterium]
MITEKRGILELGSDFFRETSVIVFVFGFLDRIIRSEAISVLYFSGVIFTAALDFMVGLFPVQFL